MLPQPAAGTASGFGVGTVTSFLDAMLTDRLGMGLGPTVGAQRGQIPFATQQAVEHVFHVSPDVQMVAMAALSEHHDRQDLGGGWARGEREPFYFWRERFCSNWRRRARRVALASAR